MLYTDGGGKRRAALNPIRGRDRIVRFYGGHARKGAVPTSVQRAFLNGNPGFIAHGPEGAETLALEISSDHIVAIYAVRNPDKLRHLG